MIRRAGAVAGVVVLSAGLAACTVNVNTEGATAQETHSFKVGAAPVVALDTFDGAIEVHSWDRPEVEVVVEKQAQDDGLLQQIVVEKTQDGDRVTLRVRGPANTQHDGIQIGIIYSPTARLRVAVPKATALELRSGDGSVRVTADKGSALGDDWSVETNDGTVELRLPEDLAAEVDARTSDGSIRSSHPHLTVPEPEGENRDEDRRSLKATLGAGGRALRVRTGDGSIRFES